MRTQEVVGYRAAHSRLVRLMGPASEHQCVCGAPAEQYAYDHRDPNEIESPNGVYSLDPERYIPLCRRCHAWMDGCLSGRIR